jgi:glycerol-3-phosphate dehydrogenase
MTNTATYDLFIIGGGINGAGIARDAAGRGLSVGLCEQGDFAGATSSASTKLIHGGLRYLEYYEFRLVAEALAEREHLLAIAPHISWPLRFVMPHVKELRPRWMIRLGLWLYDHIGGRISLPHSHGVSLTDTPYGAGLRADLTRGFVYSDAWVDDARLVILNLRSAQKHGAEIFARTRMAGARREEGVWVCTLEDSHGQSRREIRSRALVNAAGPWVVDVESQLDAGASDKRRRAGVKLVRGSHIIVPKLFAGEHAYILQNDDRRVIFMIPYEGKFTLIGTTDVPQSDMKGGAQISAEEEDYLLRAVNRYLAKPVDRDAIVWRYAGVRPLFDDESDDPSAVTRDYTLMLDDTANLPSLSIYGGKITTYRRLAESALDKLAPWLPAERGKWTSEVALPGGEFKCADHDAQLARLYATYAKLPPAWLTQVFHRHGLATYELLGDAKVMEDLGHNFGGGLTEREVEHFVRNEWAYAPDDILWRRTKCGLHMTPEQRAAFSEYFSTVPEVAGQNK